MTSCVINGNHMGLPSDDDIDAIKIGGAINQTSIVGNTFGGEPKLGYFARRYRRGIFLVNFTECAGLVISGNSFSYPKAAAIVTEGQNVDEPVRGLILSNNTFYAVNSKQEEPDLAGIYSTRNPHDDCIFTSNAALAHEGTYLFAGIGNTPPVFTDCSITNNQWNKTSNPIGNIEFVRLTGDISSQSSSRYYNLNGTLTSETNSPNYLNHTRNNSTGGSVFTFNNDLGSVGVAFTPNAAGGAFSPTTDGDVSLGTSARKWSQVYSTVFKSSDFIIELDPEELSLREVILDLRSRIETLEA